MTVDMLTFADVEAVESTQDTTLAMNTVYEMDGAELDNETTISTDRVLSLLSDVSDVEAVPFIGNPFTIDSAINYFDEYTNLIAVKKNFLDRFGVSSEVELTAEQRAAYNQSIASYRSDNIISLQDDVIEPAKNAATEYFPDDTFFTDTVLPYSNFDTIDSYTYFTHPLGYVGTLSYIQVRRREPSLVNRGAWSAANTYKRDDYVTSVNELGVQKEWVCISTDATIQSQLLPYQDYNNWRQMQYTSVESVSLKKASLIDGAVSLVATGSVYTPIVGYLPTHYRFNRDYRLGIIRHQWLGCVQSDSTTTDGRPVVETLFSAGDTLTVNNAGEPILPTNNQAGPILDVQ